MVPIDRDVRGRSVAGLLGLSPKATMNFARVVQQQRSPDLYGFRSPVEQFSAGDQKVPARKRGELFGRKRVHDGSNSRPVHLTHAHRTRLAARVQHAAPNLIRREVANRCGDQIGFGVSGWIAICPNSVLRGQHNLAIENQASNGWFPANRASRASSIACFAKRSSISVDAIVCSNRQAAQRFANEPRRVTLW